MLNKRARTVHDDPLSAASAGLVAVGIDRARRVDVLEVLGCLLDRADAAGAVVLDRELFEREEALGVDKCLDAYTLLEQLGVLSRTDRGWIIEDYRWHAGPVGETEASLAVLRRHLAFVGADAAESDLAAVAFEHAPSDPVAVAAVLPVKKWRRVVPIAAGIAASAAVITGVAQIVPQAAVSGRVAVSAQPQTTEPARTPGDALSAPGVARADPPNSFGVAAADAPSPGASEIGATPSPGPACAVRSVTAAVERVEIVALPFQSEGGDTVWAAVVKGTATVTDPVASLLLPELDVVVHLTSGDTDPVAASFAVPVLQPGQATPFNAVVALGTSRPSEPPLASATPAGVASC